MAEIGSAVSRKIEGHKEKSWGIARSIGTAMRAFTRGTGRLKDDSLPTLLEKENCWEPIINEIAQLKLESPLSTTARRYHFAYQGYDFHWKGTTAVKGHNFARDVLAFNHLKLVAVVPGSGSSTAGTETKNTEICLAKYTSLAARRKSGHLEVFDSVVE